MPRPGEVKIELEESNPERDEEGYFNCNKCPRRFFTQAGFILHLKNRHGPVLSLEQQKTLPQDSGTVQKQMILGKQIPHQYKESNTTDEHKSILMKQENSVHRELTPHQCQVCKACYSGNYTLQRHIKMFHEKLMPDECQKKFIQKSQLQNHNKILYEKIYPYQCQECNLSYGRNSTLKRHINIVHKKLMLHTCHKCQKGFAYKWRLQNHNHSVHGKVYLHQCQECNRSFGTNFALQKHIDFDH